MNLRAFDLSDRDVLLFQAGAVYVAVRVGYLPWWNAPLAWSGGALVGLGILRVARWLTARVDGWAA